MKRVALLLLGLAVCAFGGCSKATDSPSASHAGDRSIGYAFWSIDGSIVRLRVVLPAWESHPLSAAEAPPPDINAVSAAVSSHLAVSAGGRDCPAIDQGEGVGQVYTMAPTPGVERFEMIFDCPQSRAIVLRDHLLFDRAPDHVDYALVGVDGTPSTLQIFTAKRQEIALGVEGGVLNTTNSFDFAKEGAWRLLTAPEGLCLIAGVLLLAWPWPDPLLILAGLAIGYSIAILIGVLGFEAPDGGRIKTALNMLIVVIAACAVRTRASALPAKWRIGVVAILALLIFLAVTAAIRIGASTGLVISGMTIFGMASLWASGESGAGRWIGFTGSALFGVLDGSSLTSVLYPLHLDILHLLPFIIGHASGSMLTIITVAGLGLAGCWMTIRKLPAGRYIVEDFASAGLIGLGVFWLANSLYV